MTPSEELFGFLRTKNPDVVLLGDWAVCVEVMEADGSTAVMVIAPKLQPRDATLALMKREF